MTRLEFLNDALLHWLDSQTASLSDAAAALSAAYRKGESSSHVSLAAYVATRVPATLAANRKVHAALAEAWPAFSPATLLDVGTGPGTATWAAVEAWPTLASIIQCEPDKHFAELAQQLARESNIVALQQAMFLPLEECKLAADIKADVVIASYMLAELPLAEMPNVARRLWERAGQVLILIEPGTPKGFARLKAVREAVLPLGAHVLAPCTHGRSCPMTGGDWCHFKVRVQRSRIHMHAKQATVPFEDEPFSYLIVARNSTPQAGARILSPPQISKVSANLRLCENGVVREAVIASRDKPQYKRAKKTRWGDRWE